MNNSETEKFTVITFIVSMLIITVYQRANKFVRINFKINFSAMDTLFFDRKEKAAKDLKIGKFMTEFGAILDTPEGNRELNFLLSLME